MTDPAGPTPGDCTCCASANLFLSISCVFATRFACPSTRSECPPVDRSFVALATAVLAPHSQQDCSGTSFLPTENAGMALTTQGSAFGRSQIGSASILQPGRKCLYGSIANSP